MKKITILLLIQTLFFTGVSSQNTRWERIFGLIGKREMIHDMIGTYDKGLLIAGVIEGKQGAIVKTDVNGQVLFQKTLVNSNESVSLWGVVQDNDNNFYVAGLMKAEVSWPFVTKFDSCGNKEWCLYLTEYPSTGGMVQDMIINNNNEIIALIFYEKMNSKDHVFLAGIGMDGKLLWKKPYARSADYPWMLNSIGYHLMEVNNEYYITGSCYYPFPWDTTHVYLRPMFIGIDENFNEKWTRPYEPLGWVIGEAFKSIPINDTLFMGVGIRRSAQNGEDNSLLMFYNDKGQEQGYNLIPNELIGEDVRHNSIRNIERINDTLFITSTPFGPDLDNNPGGELIIDTAGNVFGMESRPGSVNAEIVRSYDGNFVFGTSYYNASYHDYNYYLFKVNDTLGPVGYDTTHYVYDSVCPFPIPTETVDITDCMLFTNVDDAPTPAQYYESIRWVSVKAFPNPVTEGKLTLAFENTEHHQNLELCCYDNFGRQIHNQRIYKGQQDTDLEVASWPKGIYIAVIYSNGLKRGTEKFVIQ